MLLLLCLEDKQAVLCCHRWAESKGIPQSELPALNVLAAAGTGGILYWISIYPIDVVKSALQTDSIDPSKRNYANSLDAAKVGLPTSVGLSSTLEAPEQLLS